MREAEKNRETTAGSEASLAAQLLMLQEAENGKKNLALALSLHFKSPSFSILSYSRKNAVRVECGVAFFFLPPRCPQTNGGSLRGCKYRAPLHHANLLAF